MSEVETSLLCM